MLTELLDESQKAAVDHESGPCMVLAGPGSGKTRVVVERFSRLVTAGHTVLVLTYTVAAAREMQERAAKYGWAEQDEGASQLTNFHTFARSVIREYGPLLGYSPHFRTPDGGERRLRLHELLVRMQPDQIWHPADPESLERILVIIDRARQQLIAPGEMESWLALVAEESWAPAYLCQNAQQCAAVYRETEAMYREHGLLDHDGVIQAAVAITGHQRVREELQDRFQYLMVDEYQDTNIAQTLLVRHLAPPGDSVMVVADDDQAIYAFRGAQPAQMAQFSRLFPSHKTIRLAHNYRSAPAIVRAARQLIGPDDDTVPPPAADGEPLSQVDKAPVPGGTIQVWEAASQEDEFSAVVAACRQLVQSGTESGKIAWLFRANADANLAARLLSEAGIPVVRAGSVSLLTHPVIKGIYALLTAIAEPENHQAVLRCLQLPRWSATPKERSSQLQSWKTGRQLPASHPVHQLMPALQDLHNVAEEVDIRDLLHTAIAVSGIAETGSPLASRLAGEFAEVIDRFCDWSPDHRLSRTLQYLSALAAGGDASAESTQSEDGVTVSTVHAAKGREWDIVFLSGCNSRAWPSVATFWKPFPSTLGNEEQRLFYVGITRARSQLIMTFSHRIRATSSRLEPAAFLTAVMQGSRQGWKRLAPTPQPQNRTTRTNPVSAAPQDDRTLLVSAQALEVMQNCPRQFAYQHIYGLDRPQTTGEKFERMARSLLLATATHGKRTFPGPAATAGDAWLFRDAARAVARIAPFLGESCTVEARLQVQTDHAVLTSEDVITQNTHPAECHVIEYTPSLLLPPNPPPSLLVSAVALGTREKREVIAELHSLTSDAKSSWRLTEAGLDSTYRNLAYWGRRYQQAVQEGLFAPRPSLSRCRRCPYRTVCDEGQAHPGS